MKAEKSRPAGGQAATQNNAQRKSTLTTRVYVARLVTLGESRGPIPIYGSPEWEELPAADPRRFAAVVRAAEAWRRDGTPEAIAARLRAELDDADLFVRYRISEASRDVSRAVANTPRYGEPFSEVRRRRAEALRGEEVAA